MEKYRKFMKVTGEAIFYYGLLGWIYGVLIQLIYEPILRMGLIHLVPWIRVDTFSVLSFLASIVGFFLWRLSK